ncbi:prolyl oligopeptidase family serine peptidase [Acetobacter sp.]|uniref:S9 family peptidase n=1 Tax=Acetobacter sp. TaxID=440 RepID=UPI0039E9F2BC
MTRQHSPENFSGVARKAAPCGTWHSPVTPMLVAGQTVTLSEITVSVDTVFWRERRPAEKGRTTLVVWRTGAEPHDLTPAEMDVATKVHEYGGGSYAVHGETIVFSNRADGNVYTLRLSAPSPKRLTGSKGARYASFAFSPDGQTVFAVRENHQGGAEPVNTLVGLALADGTQTTIASGADFYSTPTPSPDGTQLAWIEWTHPAMPWTSTRLCVQRLDDAASRRVLTGDDQAESVTEPQWIDNDTLLALTDRSGWWNIWRFDLSSRKATPVCPMAAEIGQPHWVFGQRSYTLLPDGRILALAVSDGQTRTLLLKPENGGHTAETLDLGVPEQCPIPFGNHLVWLNAPADAPPAIVTGAPSVIPHVIRAATALPFSGDDIALPESIHFPLADGAMGHAFFYPPTNSRYSVPDGEKPPMIVTAHGGPTARANEGFSFKVQWWTSRGFSVLDVNYSGSTGFGRAYQQRLEGHWGVRDVEDCIAAAQFMAENGRIDPKRIAIRGSSAGGMTVLSALANSTIFAAGVSLYGVTDLRTLAEETHKFEARYLDSLVGSWPEEEAIYRSRSPLFMADRIHVPVLFLQGLDDSVVPPEQARSMVAALHKNGVAAPLIEFPGEGHGFRGEETVKRAFQLELLFYGRVFGFTPADISLSEVDQKKLDDIRR